MLLGCSSCRLRLLPGCISCRGSLSRCGGLYSRRTSCGVFLLLPGSHGSSLRLLPSRSLDSLRLLPGCLLDGLRLLPGCLGSRLGLLPFGSSCLSGCSSPCRCRCTGGFRLLPVDLSLSFHRLDHLAHGGANLLGQVGERSRDCLLHAAGLLDGRTDSRRELVVLKLQPGLNGSDFHRAVPFSTPPRLRPGPSGGAPRPRSSHERVPPPGH